jgi:AcrR family transcriptional regulator
MDEIAAVAHVSVKTIYNHFSNKADLFNGVIRYICVDDILNPENHTEETLLARFDWFGDFTSSGVEAAGRQYLSHLLSEEQLALYRTVVRDAGRFPEIGRLYKSYVTAGRTSILTCYFSRNTHPKKWSSKDISRAVTVYESLLRAQIYEDALIGIHEPTPHDIAVHAKAASHILAEVIDLAAEPTDPLTPGAG